MQGNRTGIAIIVVLVSALLALAAGPLVKFGVIAWQLGLAVFALGSLLAGIGGLVCLVMLVRRRTPLRIAAAVIGLIIAAIFIRIVMIGTSVPRIHDITTDATNPPQFIAITPDVRGPGSNSLAYDPAITPLQVAAYPAIRTQVVAAPPAAVFGRLLRYVTDRGWSVAVANAATGRIEATETAGWWGFKDDVVIRLAPQGDGTRIDIRSVSRVGEGDFGANAARIERLIEAAGR